MTRMDTTRNSRSSAIINGTADEVLPMLRLFYGAEVKGRGMVLEADKSEAALQRAVEWMTKPGGKQWLFLTGNCGTGKTTLLKAIRNTLLEYNVENLSLRASDFPNWFINNEEQTRLSLLHGDWCRVLLLDDIGVEQTEIKDYGNVIQPFIKIVEERYSRMLPMVVSTNLSGKEMTDRYGARTIDRIKEMSEYIKYNAKSFRK